MIITSMPGNADFLTLQAMYGKQVLHCGIEVQMLYYLRDLLKGNLVTFYCKVPVSIVFWQLLTTISH
jgi:hypothetical protein